MRDNYSVMPHDFGFWWDRKDVNYFKETAIAQFIDKNTAPKGDEEQKSTIPNTTKALPPTSKIPQTPDSSMFPTVPMVALKLVWRQGESSLRLN